jgi:hypothetical protein
MCSSWDCEGVVMVLSWLLLPVASSKSSNWVESMHLHEYYI